MSGIVPAHTDMDSRRVDTQPTTFLSYGEERDHRL
jgi:hypothetical protein